MGSLLIRTLVLIGVMQLAAVSQAAVPTNITPDGTLGTDVRPPVNNVYDIIGGTRRGSNLFHSFALFSVGGGDTANFFNETGLATTNILSRVTGMQRSEIFGRIQTEGFGGANLFLINPAGWIFGPTASLNVGGAFHVSTANYVRFPDLPDGTKVKFSADTSPLPASGLTVNPIAFGFLGPTVAGITIDRSLLVVPQDRSLSVVGGDIQMVGGRLTAPSGQIHIASVASAGEVPLSGDFKVGDFARMGEINLSQGTILSVNSPAGAGTVLIRGGQLIANNSSIFADTLGNADADPRGIDLQAAEDIVLANGTLVRTQKLGLGARRAGNISLSSRNLTLMTGANVRSTGGGASGQAGNVTATAEDSVVISGSGSGIFAASVRAAEGTGNISVEARNGNVTVTGRAEIRSGSDIEQGGNVTVTAKDSVIISDKGGISSRAFDKLVAEVAVSAANVMMDDGFIRASTRGEGDAGKILVSGRNVSLMRGSHITSSSEGSITTGNGGNVTIQGLSPNSWADSVMISGGSGIFSNAEGIGDGGNITVRAGQVDLDNGTISARSTRTLANAGQAGTITIHANTLRGRNSSVTTQAENAGGGKIDIKAQKMVHLVQSEFTTAVKGGFKGAGDISIDPQFVILDRSRISADAFGGPGGNVTIVGDIFLNSRSLITASSALSTPGKIDIQASITDVSGALAQLPEDVLQAATLLRASCAARLAGGKASSLVLGGRDGLPLEPGGLLPSPLYLEGQASAPSTGPRVTGLDRPASRFSILGSKAALNLGCTS